MIDHIFVEIAKSEHKYLDNHVTICVRIERGSGSQDKRDDCIKIVGEKVIMAAEMLYQTQIGN